MRTIWKYPLVGINEEYVLSIPCGAQLLDVQFQEARGFSDTASLVAWFTVDTEETEKTTWRIAIATTGNPFPKAMDDLGFSYLRTLQRNGIVLHVYFMVEPVFGYPARYEDRDVKKVDV